MGLHIINFVLNPKHGIIGKRCSCNIIIIIYRPLVHAIVQNFHWRLMGRSIDIIKEITP